MPNEDNRIYLEFPASEVKIELGETITFDNVSGFLDSGRVLYNETSLTDVLTHLENDKADADDVYTKTEVDNALDLKADKANTYTKTEVDSSLDLKADKSNTYTKSEVDTLIPTKTSELRNDSGFTSIDDTQTANDKTWSSEKIANSIPDVSNYYNKEETDALLENKADKSELYNVYPTDEASGAIAHITDGADNVPVKSLVSEIVAVETGSGEKSPDNPYIISGFDNAVITRCGVNLWDEQWVSGYLNATGGITSGTNYLCSKNLIPIKPNTTYYIKGVSGTQRFFAYYDLNGNFLSRVQNNGFNITFTTPPNAYYMRFDINNSYGSTYNNDISINYPSTDTQYHAYNGNTYTISFGQTVYGGTLNVTTGVLDIDWVDVDLGSLTWFRMNNPYSALSSTFLFRAILSDTPAIPLNAILDCYEWVLNFIYFNTDKVAGYIFNKEIAIRDDDYTDANDFKNSLNGRHMIYKLGTPITVQLTPTEVKTLLGENNIYSDTGDVEVNYHADIGLYIDKKVSSLAQG